MTLKSNQGKESYASKDTVRSEFRVVIFPHMLNLFSRNRLSLFDPNSSDMRCSSRVRARGISSLNFKRTALYSAKVSGMNSSMLRTGGSDGSPTSYGTVPRREGEHKFSLKIDYISPVKDDGRKGILDSNSKIGKENAGSLDVDVDRETQEDHNCREGDIFACGVITISEHGVEHSGTEDVAEHGVGERASRAKNLCVAATLIESSIRAITHE